MKHLLKPALVLSILSVFIFSSCETNKVTNITLDSATKKMVIGQIDSLFTEISYDGNIVPSIVWVSNNTSVVKVTNGEIEAVSKGTAVITAQAGDKSASCTVTVDDKILPQLTKGELWYWGDIYTTGNAHNFTVCIASNGINMEDLTGDGEFMYLEMNTDTTFTDSIPNGVYEVNESLAAGSLVPAWVDDNGSPWGTWYFGNSYNDVVSGSAVLTVNSGVYSIDYDFVDYYGNTISGSYLGKLTYIDVTKQSGAPKQLKKNRSSLKINKIKQPVKFAIH